MAECAEKRRLFVSLPAALVTICLISEPAYAEVKIDIASDVARQAAGVTYLDDLSVRDSALIYESFCVKDGGLFVPGWTTPADLANNTYTPEGVILRVEVLPGKKLKGTFVDAAQAQQVAKGNINAKSVLQKADYDRKIRESINRIFDGGLWGTETCDRLAEANSLRPLQLFEVESLNGFTSLSGLLKSVSARAAD